MKTCKAAFVNHLNEVSLSLYSEYRSAIRVDWEAESTEETFKEYFNESIDDYPEFSLGNYIRKLVPFVCSVTEAEFEFLEVCQQDELVRPYLNC